MHLYLANWIGDGTEGNEYRPNVDAGAWAAIDFRPDSTVQDGRVLVATDQSISTLPTGVVDLGDLLDEVLARPNIRGIEQRLGVTLQGQSLRQIIAELLIVHGESDIPGRTRWKRLQQTRSGRHVIRLLGETLYDAPAVVGTVITESFDQTDSTTLGPDLTWAEVLGDMQTIINSATRAAGTGTTDSTPDNLARAESDLASDDHYAEGPYTLLTNVGGNRNVAVGVRFSASADTAYWAVAEKTALEFQLYKRVAGSNTQLGVLAEDPLSDAGARTLRAEAVGSTIRCLADDVEKVSVTDTDITGNTRTGIGVSGGAAHDRHHIVSFEAGDLEDPDNVTAFHARTALYWSDNS